MGESGKRSRVSQVDLRPRLFHNQTNPLTLDKTDSRSTALRSGRDDKGRGVAEVHGLRDGEKPQVPPLRYAPVGMTIL